MMTRHAIGAAAGVASVLAVMLWTAWSASDQRRTTGRRRPERRGPGRILAFRRPEASASS